jgi:hypothetical protein
MSAFDENDETILPRVMSAPHALVLLSVPWSGPERMARCAFRSAGERLAAEEPVLAVDCFAVDEEAQWCQAWLVGLSLPQLSAGSPLGAGSILWLESGRVVAFEVAGRQLRAYEIVARTRRLWSK